MTKYNVGDTVLVKPLKWYNKHKKLDGKVNVYYGFPREMSYFCGKKAIVTYKDHDYYHLRFFIKSSDTNTYTWTDEMLSDITEQRKEKLKTLKKIKT